MHIQCLEKQTNKQKLKIELPYDPVVGLLDHMVILFLVFVCLFVFLNIFIGV